MSQTVKRIDRQVTFEMVIDTCPFKMGVWEEPSFEMSFDGCIDEELVGKIYRRGGLLFVPDEFLKTWMNFPELRIFCQSSATIMDDSIAKEFYADIRKCLRDEGCHYDIGSLGRECYDPDLERDDYEND